MTYRLAIGFVAFMLVVLIVADCGSDKAGLGDFCEKDSDCSSGLVCEEGVCIKTSSNVCDPPCGENEVCHNGTCVVQGDPEDKDGDGHQIPPDGNDCDDFNANVFPGAVEYCDAIDNNCDGNTDENCPACPAGTAQDCGTDVGECTVGVQSCTDGLWEACSGISPVPELCDGKDNDCDGMTDETCPCTDGEQLTCGLNQGTCVEGTQTCESGAWTGCHGGQLPQQETCDNQDNDCDGTIDDGFNLAFPCQGEGECGAGIVECAAEFNTRCDSMPGGSNDQSSVEICDLKDNDCDELTDEGLEGDQAPNECTIAEDVGALPDDGSSQIISGNLWPPGDEDWYKVLATDDVLEDLEDNCDRFNFKIRFLENPGGNMLIDVYAESCSDPTDLCTDDTEYDHAYNGQFENEPLVGQCPCSADSLENQTICSSEPKTFYFRVHGPSGQDATCENYQISISNGVE
ncbi:MAG: putative metal-binding motif-containing protein [Deltaproteobacteria bacterium]|nr:putative metal-binding motif-containing protein [Deltaproteobacteria bacterium]